MIKYLLLVVVVWALPCTTAHAGDTTPVPTQVQTAPVPSWDDIVKESIDATHTQEMEFSLTGSPAPSDLTLDPDFIGNGMWGYSPIPLPEGASLISDSLRVFPYRVCNPFCSHRGYYTVDRVQNTDGTWRSAITRRTLTGGIDPYFGSLGWMYPSASVVSVADAAMGAGRMYILTNIEIGGVKVIRVSCTVLVDGSSCFALGQGYLSFGATTTGAVRSAVGQRIIYDSRYGLLIAGRIFTVARGWEIAIARIDATSGLLVTEFRGNGMNTGLPPWATQSGSEIEVYDMAVVPQGAPGGERLYIAGKVKYGTFQGFLLGLDPNNGYTSSGWSWKHVTYDADNNNGYVDDAVTAITVLRNGKLAIAGWSQTNTPNEQSMILARYNTDGSYDWRFCDAENICKRNMPWPGVVDNDWPVAIAEREGNRELVVALKHRRPAASDPRERQLVVQFTANGNLRRAQRTMDFPADDGVTAWSRPFGMWMGQSTSGEVIAVVGTRKYNSSDYDSTISKLISTDSIFADTFGGPHND